MNTGRIFLLHFFLLIGSVFLVEGVLLLWIPVIGNAWSMITFGLGSLLVYLFLKMCYTNERKRESGGKR